MQNDEGKQSFFLRLKFANYNVIYQTFSKYSILINQEILMALFKFFKLYL